MSVLPLAALRKSRLFIPVQSVMRDWLREDLPTIIYIIKMLLACLLALWLSLRFELDQPRTAMLTVAIVMQSKSGMVFTKSFYRLMGSIVGIFVSFVLVAMFAQERMLFILCMAIWIGFCTAGSMVFRHHQSYAFVLAGYTICIVGLPATITPELTFSIGVTRISEIMIGLLSASLISDLVFPQRMWDGTLAAVRRRFSDFSDLLRLLSIDQAIGTRSKSVVLKFVGDIFELESLRASSGLENDKSRAYRFRLNSLNSEFMSVSTTFHSLEQLLRRQHNNGHPEIVNALLNLYQPIKEAISLGERSVHTEHEAKQVSFELKHYRDLFPQQLSVCRNTLPDNLVASERLDFETGAELMQRFVDELYTYAQTYSSLAYEAGTGFSDNEANQNVPRFKVNVDVLAVSLAGVRGAFALLVMTTLWILADWRSGVEAITIGIITSTLFASSPSPNRTVKQFIIGALFGTVLVYICNFQLLPEAQGFVMLALAVTPAIVLAAWLTTRPAVATMGSGIFIIFFMHIGFNTAYSANPVAFMNDAIADVIAIMMSGVMYSLIDLTNSRWSRQRVSTALRELVVSACRDSLPLRRALLESSARGLVERLGGTRRVADEQDKEVTDWLLSTLEIGHAVIALREQLSEVDCPSVRQPFIASLEHIAELYTLPTSQNRLLAIAAIDHAMATLSFEATLAKDATLADETTRNYLSQSTHHQLLTMLHFIHCVLLDEESVLSLRAPLALSAHLTLIKPLAMETKG